MGQIWSTGLLFADLCCREPKPINLKGLLYHTPATYFHHLSVFPLGVLYSWLPCYLLTSSSSRQDCEFLETRICTLLISVPSKLNNACTAGGTQNCLLNEHSPGPFPVWDFSLTVSICWLSLKMQIFPIQAPELPP